MQSLLHFRDAVKARLHRDLDHLQQRLSSGACSDYATYREMAGGCKQLRAAIGMLDEELKKLQEDDDE